MLDICLLGTGGMMPLPNRWLTALMARYNGSNLLIDCGEGTQITIKLKGWSFKSIDTLCFTHYHGDHISGLPGLLLTMGNSDRTEPLTLVGPKGLERVVNGLRVIAPELPFELKFIELSENYQELHLNGYKIEAYRLNHKVTCYGYNLVIDRIGKFDVERAKAANIPMKFWNPLQKGETVVDGAITYSPDMVLGEARKGLKVSYCTDSRPVENIVTYAKGADIFICEGMYGDREEADKAREKKHMAFWEAAKLAKDAEVSELWLTHFSPALVKPKQYEHVAKKIFPNTHIAKDRYSRTLKFLDE